MRIFRKYCIVRIRQREERKAGEYMKIEVKLEETVQETTVIIIARKMSEDVTRIVEKLSEETPQVIAGFKEDLLEILQPSDIFRVYAANQKVYAVTPKGEYLLRSRLYEMESRLAAHGFIRISNSEIVNLSKIKNFDLSYTGTIGVTLSDGTTTYVSRRYMSKIKAALGI